ncbi:MAG: nitroreductase family protein [Prevotellaceae bacterium]|jgi:nitroreductase|nr:nitroreductase family protein [Prevotellaceae bacterium]
MKSLNERRTIRHYTTQPVPVELLNDLLAQSFRASTTGNMQLYSIVVSTDKERIAALSPAHYHQTAIRTAPAVLTFCADFHRFSLWCRQSNAEPGYENFQSFMNAAMDTLIVAQTFCMLAEEAGLGICYLGTTTYNPQEIIETLQLPRLVFPVTTITIGYPDEHPEQADRLPAKSLIHNERYYDYTPEEIRAAYTYKESLPESQKFIAENNKETLAQVFTNVRYARLDNERISENLIQTLRQQGFFDLGKC